MAKRVNEFIALLLNIKRLEGVSKVILSSKTPPSLRATSSINRGGAGDSSRRKGVFSTLPLFIEGVRRSREGVREMTFASPCFFMLLLPQIDNVHFRVGVLVKTEEVYIQFLLWFL